MCLVQPPSVRHHRVPPVLAATEDGGASLRAHCRRGDQREKACARQGRATAFWLLPPHLPSCLDLLLGAGRARHGGRDKPLAAEEATRERVAVSQLAAGARGAGEAEAWRIGTWARRECT
eukprot:360626-Chlamydomonas_euryale.AAC.6